MSAAAALLPQLAAAGIEAWAEGGRVRLRGRQPTPDLLAELRAHRDELLDLLASEPVPAGVDAPDDWTSACQAIRDARLPPSGTPERDCLDRDHAAMCAGLLAGYLRHVGGAV